jgi:hypothetical protein
MEDFFVYSLLIIYFIKWIFHYLIICFDEDKEPSFIDFYKRLTNRLFSTQFYLPFYFSNEYDNIDLDYSKLLKVTLWIWWLVFIVFSVYKIV